MFRKFKVFHLSWNTANRGTFEVELLADAESAYCVQPTHAGSLTVLHALAADELAIVLIEDLVEAYDAAGRAGRVL